MIRSNNVRRDMLKAEAPFDILSLPEIPGQPFLASASRATRRAIPLACIFGGRTSPVNQQSGEPTTQVTPELDHIPGESATVEPQPSQTGFNSLPYVIAAGILIEVVLCLLTSLWLLPRFFPGPGVSVEFHEMLGDENWLSGSFLQLAAFVLLFGAYSVALVAIRALRQRRIALIAVFAAPIVWSCTTIFMYPPYAVDLFHYVAEMRLLWVYGLNPMTVPPIARPFPIGISFMDLPGDYGPLWYIIGFPATLFHQHDLLYAVMALKAWISVFYISSGAIIYYIMRSQRRDLALFAAMVYLWNPFIIIRALGDAHNDFVMIFFVLLTFYMGVKEKWLLVPPVLMLSVLVKYASLLLGPIFFVYVLFLPSSTRNKALRHLFVGTFFAVVLAVAFFKLFWDGLNTFASLRYVESQSITSIPLLVQYFITEPIFGDQSGNLSRFVMQILFLIPYGWFVLRVRPPIERLEGAAYQVLWFYVVLALAWFRPWYFAWVVALGALLPWGWYLAMTLTISWFGMFPDIVEQYRVHVPWLADNLTALILAPIVVAFLPPILVWLVGAVQTGSFSFLPARGRTPDLAEHPAD